MKPLIPSLCLILLAGCTHDPAPPWRWMELGHRPLAQAWDHGNWIRVDVEDHTHWVIPNFDRNWTGVADPKLNWSDLHCGDRLRLHPKDGHPALLSALPKLGQDSVTLRWQCANLEELTQWHMQRLQLQPTRGDDLEARWLALLQKHLPDEGVHNGARVSEGDSIRLAISTWRADGEPLEPDTVRLSFILGDPDQVVPALAPGLARVTNTSQWTVWSSSAEAFGSGAHPELGLPAHMPLRFSVKVE